MLYVINFKTYLEATGDGATRLANAMKKVSEETNSKIIACPQFTDIPKISDMVPTFSQHIDPILPGPSTGHILAEAVKEAGAVGTLLNHSEKRISLEEIDFLIKRCREIGLKTIVCCSNVEECEKVSNLKPDYIAIEPPDLIGTGRSISKERPGLITDVRRIVDVPLLCGAGISSREDVEKAKELGAVGVLISSEVVESKYPYKTLKEMVI